MPDTPPFDFGPNPNPDQVLAELAGQLEEAAFVIENLASTAKSLKLQAARVAPAQMAYGLAGSQFNNISTTLIAIMRKNIKPPKTPPNMNDAQQALNDFQAKVTALISQAGGAHAMLASSTLGDVLNVFDSIFKAIEWFVSRKDTEREGYADLLAANQVRSWDEAGTPRPAPPSSSAKNKPSNDDEDKKGGSGDTTQNKGAKTNKPGTKKPNK